MRRSNTQSVVITGASAGVGRATAREFARQGWNVGLLARGVEGLEAAAAEIRACGAEAMTLPADVADADAVFAAADHAVRHWGRIDVWVNCAMATVYGAAWDLSPAEHARVTNVTYLGYVHGTLAALRHMRERGAGTIVQVGSALSYRAIPLQSAYCASKFAVRGFTDSLRSELIAERSRVRLCMVQLPAVNTPQFDWARNYMPRHPRPVAPVFQPEGIAREIYRASLRAPRELWIGRPTAQAIFANAAAPGILDRLLARTAIPGQQIQNQPKSDGPGNLFSPVSGDAGARGRFDAEARAEVSSVRPATLRLLALLGVLAIAALSAGGRTRRAPRRDLYARATRSSRIR
jgi:short-subunit dehydrogenase